MPVTNAVAAYQAYPSRRNENALVRAIVARAFAAISGFHQINRADHQDIAQIVALRVFQPLVSSRPAPGTENGYVASTARNEAVNWLRRSINVFETPHDLIDEILEFGLFVADADDPEWYLGDLSTLIEQLKPMDQRVIVGYYIDGADVSTLAAEEQVGEDAIYQRLRRARKRLAVIIGDCWNLSFEE